MDITRRCDYACRILRVAYKSGDEYVSVSDIAEREDIPYAFARSIQHDLMKAGLVRTVRGAHGGLVLNGDPADITVLDVLEAVQGPVSVSLCAVDPSYCEKHVDCVYNKVWHGADRLLNDYFSRITLRDLFERGGAHPVIAEAMGHAAPAVFPDVAANAAAGPEGTSGPDAAAAPGEAAGTKAVSAAGEPAGTKALAAKESRA